MMTCATELDDDAIGRRPFGEAERGLSSAALEALVLAVVPAGGTGREPT